MAKPTQAVPKGFRTVTPAIIVKGAAKAIDFYKKALGAEEVMRMPGADGSSIMHAELKIGDSIIFLSDEFPDMGMRSPLSMGGATGSLFLYVSNVDAAMKRAVEAGAQVAMPAADMFWGDRYGKVTDPFGHQWGLATHIEEVSPVEMKKRAAEWTARMSKGQA